MCSHHSSLSLRRENDLKSGGFISAVSSARKGGRVPYVFFSAVLHTSTSRKTLGGGASQHHTRDFSGVLSDDVWPGAEASGVWAILSRSNESIESSIAAIPKANTRHPLRRLCAVNDQLRQVQRREAHHVRTQVCTYSTKKEHAPLCVLCV